MKLLVGDGRVTRVYDIGPCIMTIRAIGVPIKQHGHELLEDDPARERIRDLLVCRDAQGRRIYAVEQ